MSPDTYNGKILSTLEQIQRDVADIKSRLGSNGGGGGGPSGGEVADDADLDSKYGNPLVRFELKAKYWTGESFVGCTFSECSPEYLDATAKYLDACAFMAAKDPDEEKRSKARYKTKDAARARGWAKRLRAGGYVAPAPADEPYDPNTGEVPPADDIPF